MPSVNTPYDDVFRTLVNDCSGLMIPVINEIFSEHYAEDEPIIFLPNEHFMNSQDTGTKEKITDSCFYIGNHNRKKYHLECQSTTDSSMLIRIFEYDTQIALDNGRIESHFLRVDMPNTAVLFLRHNKNTPSDLVIEMNTPGGTVSYSVPIIKLQTYTIEEIFEKKLLFLIPFHIFCFEKELPEYEKDEKKRKELENYYNKIIARLEYMMETGELNAYEKVILVDMAKKVLQNLAQKYSKVKEGVGNIMGGRVLDHEAKRILNRGREEGRQEGRQDGEWMVLIRQIISKLKKGYGISQIADQLEETETKIQEIADAAERFAPDYNMELILEEIKNKSK